MSDSDSKPPSAVPEPMVKRNILLTRLQDLLAPTDVLLISVYFTVQCE